MGGCVPVCVDVDLLRIVCLSICRSRARATGVCVCVRHSSAGERRGRARGVVPWPPPRGQYESRAQELERALLVEFELAAPPSAAAAANARPRARIARSLLEARGGGVRPLSRGRRNRPTYLIDGSRLTDSSLIPPTTIHDRRAMSRRR